VHLLYPEKHKKVINAFIASDLASFCEAGQYIEDQVGTGAKML
jgi:diphosphomevalonate decarboxylase